MPPPADQWNKAHPNATVDVVKGGQDLTKFEAALRSGEGGPDIIQSDVSPIAREMLHKQLYDWTDRLYDIKKDFVQFKLRECTHPKTGRIYGIPYQLGVVGMYYREDLLTKAGYTHDKLQNLSWDGYLDLGRKLKKDFGLPLGASSQTGVGFFQMLHWLAGGSVTNKDGTQITLDDQIGVDTMKKVKTLFDEGLLAPTDSGSEAWWTATRQGKIPMVWAATWFGGYFGRNLASSDDGFGQWRNVELPYLQPGGPRAVNSGGAPIVSPSYIKNPDLVWGVLQYSLATVEGALAAMSTGTVLSYVPALKTKDFQDKKFPYAGDWPMNQLWAKYADNVPNTYYFTAVYDEAATIFGNYFPKMVRGEMTVEAGMKAAADEIRKANEQYVRIMQQE